MEMQEKGTTRVGVVALLAVGALSVAALALSRTALHESVASAGHTWTLPLSSEVSRTLLSDGRFLEVNGAQQRAYIFDGKTRLDLQLPEVRRFASVTVMPSGQVLLWGGIDAHGNVLDSGEWFAPTTMRFVRTGPLGLPARAGHTLTLLTDGTALMTGGWSAQGAPAMSAVLWQPGSHQSTLVMGTHETPRLVGVASLQADGSVRIDGGVDADGRDISSTSNYSTASRIAGSEPALSQADPKVAATLPAAEATTVPIQGPLALRFTTPVNVRQLANRAITLLGPEGPVPVHVFGAEGGRLAFVQLPDDLYPGSRYTLFVQGLKTPDGKDVPYTAVGFTTAQANAMGVMVAGRGQRPAPNDAGGKVAALPPITIMAGDGNGACVTANTLCRERSYIRDGAWFPGRNNAPDASGGHWRLYQPHQSLPNTHELEAALPKGATALIGQVRQIDETPVANVTVSVGSVTTRTNAQGVFVLSGLAAGRQELFVDGRSASHDDVDYGRFQVGADVEARSVARLPYVMYLPRILPRDHITLPSPTTREVVLTHPDMPGLELHIPAGTVLKDHEGHVLTNLAIVPTPVDHAPFPLPDNFPMYFTIQPGDAVVQGLTPESSKGITVVYPNYGHEKAKTPGNFWVYDLQKGWQMYGGGHVTADAQHLSPDAGVSLVWAIGAGASVGNTNPPNARKPGGECVGEPVDLQTGIFFHKWNDLAIRDVVPLVLSRANNSADTNTHMFGLGGNSNYGMYLYSANGFLTPQLVLPCGEGVAFNLVIGAPNDIGNDIWAHTGSNTGYYGATLQHFNSSTVGEYWQITMKDGTAYGFASDAPNLLLWTQDRFGNRTQMTYNGGLLEQITSPSGRSITFNYGAGNAVSSVIDNTGRTISYTYNGTGTLASVTYPDTTTEQYKYNSNNQMQTMQDRRGNVWVTNQYDANGRVATQTLADGSTYKFSYSLGSNGTVTATTVTDPNSNQEQLSFDPLSSYPLSVTRAYGTSLAQTTTYIREASGLVDSMTDALGRTTTYVYDGWGNVTRMTPLAGTANAISYQFTYTSDYNQLATITDPLQHTTSMTYTNGCLTGVTDPLGHNTAIQCNSAGQPTSIKDALGHATTFAYQGYDLRSVTDALSRTALISVDSLGRPTAIKDPMGNVTVKQYDTNDRVVKIFDALNQLTTVSYDGNGNALNVTSPNRAVITQSYNSRNWVATRTDPLKQVESWTYDGMGDLLTYTDRKKQLTTRSYDALNRTILTTYADGSTKQAIYDGGNRLSALSDSTSGNESWSYDDLNRLVSAVSPQGSIGYSYDAAGRRTGMTPAAQAVVNYTYDNANRLTSLRQGSETVQFGYDNANRRISLTLPNSVSVAYGYDTANELTGITYLSPTQATLGTLTYGYDLDGHRNVKSGSYATDLLPESTAASSTFDLNNRQTKYGGVVQAYDANGNLTNDGVHTYFWNARNQLTQITQNGATTFSYSYDAQGRRVNKTASGAGNAIQYLYDGANAVQEVQGSAINPILTGINVDERFARNDVSGRTYFLNDAIGSTIGLSDSSGAVIQQYSYDPYGRVISTDTTNGFTNPYQYTGREVDNSSLYYYRARYYSPQSGRFISEDPAFFGGGQENFYAYVRDDPMRGIDPFGLWTLQIGLSYSASLGPFSFNGGFGLALDSCGTLAGYTEGGFGTGVGANLQLGIGAHTTNGDTLGDLSGSFVNGSVSAGDGVGGTLDGLAGVGSHGQVVTGAGFSAGLGFGGSTGSSITNTTITPGISLW